MQYSSSIRKYSLAAAVACFCVSTLISATKSVAQEEPIARIAFEEVTGQSGIDFEHFSGRTGKHYILETVTAGLVTFDYDADGLVDVYLLNGAALQSDSPDTTQTNRLYKNMGAMRFVDVTEQARAGDAGFALGGIAADIDNDGDQDLVVANFGNTVFLENEGNGCFSRREVVSPGKQRIGAGLVALDIENDGDVDIYRANYVDFTFDKDVNRTIYGVPAAPGPKDYEPDRDQLLENLGTGLWQDSTVQSGVASAAGPGMGVLAFDATGDGLSDVFVCNDSAANMFWENFGEGIFQENALLVGLAYDVSGAQQATMGADAADWNHDGFIDIVTTNFIDEIPTLYENSGQGYFDDIGPAAGLGAADRSLTWGIGFGDFDNDSWDDLFIAAGHLISGASRLNDSETFEAPNLVLRNDRGKSFQSVPRDGPLAVEQVSRGAALEDFDGDGRLDVLVLNLNDRVQLLRNVTRTTSQAFRLKLVGTSASRDAAGATVRLKLSDGTLLTGLVMRGRGYQSGFGDTLHFGIGKHEVREIVVQWPGGAKQSFQPTSHQMTIVERQD